MYKPKRGSRQTSEKTFRSFLREIGQTLVQPPSKVIYDLIYTGTACIAEFINFTCRLIRILYVHQLPVDLSHVISPLHHYKSFYIILDIVKLVFQDFMELPSSRARNVDPTVFTAIK